jgi:hypothetical protein
VFLSREYQPLRRDALYQGRDPPSQRPARALMRMHTFSHDGYPVAEAHGANSADCMFGFFLLSRL